MGKLHVKFVSSAELSRFERVGGSAGFNSLCEMLKDVSSSGPLKDGNLFAGPLAMPKARYGGFLARVTTKEYQGARQVAFSVNVLPIMTQKLGHELHIASTALSPNSKARLFALLPITFGAWQYCTLPESAVRYLIGVATDLAREIENQPNRLSQAFVKFNSLCDQLNVPCMTPAITANIA